MELYNYQKKVVQEAKEKLEKYKLVYLGLEMRLGKSLIALELAKDYGKVLFVTTKSALPDVIKTNEVFNSVTDIINYESVHKLEPMKYDLVIVDEAHKISKFPKKAVARKNLEKFIGNETDVILLSGTPYIESSSQLYHQLTLSHHHEFRKYKNFYSWFKDYGIENYVRRHGGMLVKVYNQTKDFKYKYDHIMIRMTREQANFAQHDVTVNKHYFDLLDQQRTIYDAIMRNDIYMFPDDKVVTTNGSPATKLIKLQQVTGGSVITEDETVIDIGHTKTRFLQTIDKDEKIAIYYKYKGELDKLNQALKEFNFIHKPLLLQIDANNTGVDLSHLDRLIIYSLTFSGANFTQVLSRMAKKDRLNPIEVDVLLAKNTIDDYIYEAVSNKKNFNAKFLRSRNETKV